MFSVRYISLTNEVTREWRRVQNGELYILYPSQNIIHVPKYIRIRWAVNVACLGERGCTYRVLVGRPEGSRPFARPERTWEDNIKMWGDNIKMWGDNIKMWEDNIKMWEDNIKM